VSDLPVIPCETISEPVPQAIPFKDSSNHFLPIGDLKKFPMLPSPNFTPLNIAGLNADNTAKLFLSPSASLIFSSDYSHIPVCGLCLYPEAAAIEAPTPLSPAI
jgi:hypothetical protein